MFLTRLHIALRACLAIMLIWSPMASVSATSAKITASGYLCSSSGQAPSAEAKAHLESFLSLVGEIKNNGDADHTHHCPDCFVTVLGLPVQATIKAEPLRFSRHIENYFAPFNGFLFNPTGPPLGGRAPPFFQ